MTFKARTHEEPHRKCITASVISAVEIAEALFQRQLAVGQQGVPLDVPTVTEHSGQGGIDQVLLGREIAVDQGLRDAELLGQRTRRPLEADLGKKAAASSTRRRRLAPGGRRAAEGPVPLGDAVRTDRVKLLSRTGSGP